mgnify:CR=1 FL=1
MKRSARAENTVQEAARVGEELREARIALGVSVEDAATQLRINKRYLQALEEGRVKDLPGAAYAVGFVRSYATALGLDPDDAVRRFRDMSGTAVTKSGDLVFPEPVPRRGIPTGILAAAPADVFQAAAVTPTDLRCGKITPFPPNAATERMIAPKFLGSVMPSSATISGRVDADSALSSSSFGSL